MAVRCQCSDPGCPHCQGSCRADAVTVVFRIDMRDRIGHPMCDKCADDCVESGVFRTDDQALALFTGENDVNVDS